MQPPAVQRSIPGPAALVLWMKEHSDDDSHHYEEPVATTKQIRQQSDVSQTMSDNDPYIPDTVDQSSSPQGQWSI
jgi:hypothetical protein